MSNARNQRTCHRLLPAASAENKLPASAGPTSKRSFRRSFNFAVPVRSSARNASCGRGEGEKGERRRNEITGQWTKYLRPPHCSLIPPLFPTRGLRSVTGQRGGNYPATVLYLLRRRHDCVPPRHVCSPLPPPLSPSPARHRSGPRAVRDPA